MDASLRSIRKDTVQQRGIETGISETSKGSYLSLCYPERQASEFLFSPEELGSSPRGLDRLRSGSLQADLSLIV